MFCAANKRFILCLGEENLQVMQDACVDILVFKRDSGERTSCLVAFDEVRLYTMHGRTFQETIWALQHIFFAVVFATDFEHHPLLLAMMSTITMSILSYFLVLMHIFGMKL